MLFNSCVAYCENIPSVGVCGKLNCMPLNLAGIHSRQQHNITVCDSVPWLGYPAVDVVSVLYSSLDLAFKILIKA